MQALAPITVTVGQDSTLDPSQTKQPIKAVILFNASPVVVKVSGGGQDFYLQPNSTQTMPASTPLGNIVLAGVSSISSSSNSGSVYPTLIWTNDVMPGSPSASPVTDINVAGAVTVSSGSVDIGSIAAGQIIEVINSPNTQINTQSIANAYSTALTAPSGGGNVSATLNIPTSPPMHGALISGTYTITGAAAAPIQVTVTGNNTNEVYYSFINSTTGVTNEALPPKLIPISAADTALVIALDSGGNDESCTVNTNFYSNAIPPDPAMFNALIQGLFGNSAGQNVINPYVAQPLLQQIYNNQISTQKGVKVADALAPADSYATGIASLGAAGNTNIWTAPNNGILRSFYVQGETSISDILSAGVGGPGFKASYNLGTNGMEFIGSPTGLYLTSGSILTLYSSNAVNVVWGVEFTQI